MRDRFRYRNDIYMSVRICIDRCVKLQKVVIVRICFVTNKTLVKSESKFYIKPSQNPVRNIQKYTRKSKIKSYQIIQCYIILFSMDSNVSAIRSYLIEAKVIAHLTKAELAHNH